MVNSASNKKYLDTFYVIKDGKCYWMDHCVIEADLDSFKIIDIVYAKDKNNVYLRGDIISGADPKTFERIDKRYNKDASNLFYEDRQIPDVDIQSFEVLEYSYARDKNRFYWLDPDIRGYEKIDIVHEEIDPASCKIHTFHWLSDKNGVFYIRHPKNFNGFKVDGADPETFEAIDDVYGKDKNHVYKFGRIVEGADPNSGIPDSKVQSSEHEDDKYK